MTRVLSELLGAREPTFHHAISRLEAASGRASTDIQLTTEVERATKLKLKELGLDPHDTTGAELYEALQQKVKVDDETLVSTLREKYGHGEMNDHVMQAVLDLPVPKDCFALKIGVAKSLLKKQPPKHTMKLLGYRSFDSMMRREQIFTIYAVAWLLESTTWRKSMLDNYKKLRASDFEIREITVLAPNSSHWKKLADTVVSQKKHNIVGLKEFGSVVLLPYTDNKPPAATLTTLLLVLHEINEVRASSTFLKLCQVRPHFGSYVQTVITDEPTLRASIFDEPVSWQIIQRYYARFSERFKPHLFEPHIQKEDLSWHSVEKALSYIEPKLSFWHHTTNLALLDEHQPASLNVIDATLNYCNQLPFSNRLVHYFRHSLWHEMIIRYLKHENVEQIVLSSLESQLVEEPELVYSEG